MTFRPSSPKMPPATQYIVIVAMWQLGYQGKKSCCPRAAPHRMLICQRRRSCLPYLKRTAIIVTSLIFLDEKLYSNWTSASLHVSQIIKQTKFTSDKLKQRHPPVPLRHQGLPSPVTHPHWNQYSPRRLLHIPTHHGRSETEMKQEASVSYLQDCLWKCRILPYINECKVWRTRLARRYSLPLILHDPQAMIRKLSKHTQTAGPVAR
jgi:hypothetical protein